MAGSGKAGAGLWKISNREDANALTVNINTKEMTK